MNLKQPTTARLPDWERLFEQLLDRQMSLMRVAAGMQAIGLDPASLAHDLQQLRSRLKYIDQMRQVTSGRSLSNAA